LAVEVRISAKAMLLSFNTTAVFKHDVMVSENDVVEAGQCSWYVCVTLSSDCQFEPQAEWIRASR